MADEITQTRHIGQIQPTNRTRDTGPRKRPRQPRPDSHDDEDKRRRSPDGPSNRVDEYA